jgi:hypothetical protein
VWIIGGTRGVFSVMMADGKVGVVGAHLVAKDR